MSKPSNQKKVQVQPERKAFQFHEFQEEVPPSPSNNVVVMPDLEKKKPTGPWSDDLIVDKDDPSWTTVKRKIRKTK